MIDTADIHNHILEHYGEPVLPEHMAALKNLFTQSDAENWQLLAQDTHTDQQNNALTKWIDQRGTTTLRQFYTSRPKRVQRDWQPDLDELFYAIRLNGHQGYEFEQTLSDTVITKVGYTSNISQQEIDTNLNQLFNIGNDDGRT